MNQRIMLTKTLLKNSLVEILQTQNIYQISIRELCERAGINRSTFYKYYGSQYDLLAEMEQDFLHNIEEVIADRNDQEVDMIVKILVYLEKEVEFVRLLINSNVDPEFPQRLLSLALIQSAMNELMVNVPVSEQEYFHRFTLSGAYEMVRMWVNKPDRERPEWMAALLYKQIVAGKRV